MSAARSERNATRVLVINPHAGGMNEEVERKLRRAFADHLIVEVESSKELSQIVSPQARIVVAGGDGSVELIVRMFAETQHPIGIIPLGTYNNLAQALRLPPDIDKSIAVARYLLLSRAHSFKVESVFNR